MQTLYQVERTAYFVLCVLLLSSVFSCVEAAVPSNGQEGQCGPYYLWYQTGPVGPQQYLDVCSITFDLSDVMDDFDLVYFEDSESLQRASLDQNRDGISDWNFFRKQGNLLEWRPQEDCARIMQTGCESGEFTPHCAYAMIRIQPRRDFTEGSAVIPISVELNCPPSSYYECRRSFVMRHAYSDCDVSPVPRFVLMKQVKPTKQKYHDGEQFIYTATILNTGGKTGTTRLTVSVSEGSNRGALRFIQYAVACPQGARCVVPDMDEQQLQVTFENFPADQSAKISLAFEADTEGISTIAGELWTSDFTITAELSTGGQYSTPITIGHLIKQ